MTTNKRNRARTWLFTSLFGVALMSACTNPEVPAGHEGYIHHIPLIFGEMEYRDTIKGPSSTGVSWRLFTTNIDMRERNFQEEFQLLSKDDLQISFEVNTRIRLREGSVKEIVEKWGATKWYEWNVKERLRTIVRTEVMEVDAAEIQLKTDDVGKKIMQSLQRTFDDKTPIDVRSVDIGSFEFPEEVNQAIQEKIAKEQELERQSYILETTRKEAAIQVFEALKVNKRQRIIGKTLDPLYVQWAAVQVYRNLASSPNNAVVLLPNTADGTGVPQITSAGERKILTAEDEQELQGIEKYYRSIVSATSIKTSEMPSSTDANPPATPTPEPATPEASATPAQPDTTPVAPGEAGTPPPVTP